MEAALCFEGFKARMYTGCSGPEADSNAKNSEARKFCIFGGDLSLSGSKAVAGARDCVSAGTQLWIV